MVGPLWRTTAASTPERTKGSDLVGPGVSPAGPRFGARGFEPPMGPMDLIARVCALVPPPRLHMVRYHGVLSSHAKARSEVVPHPDVATSPGRVVQLELFGDNESTESEPRRKPWGMVAPACFWGGPSKLPPLRRSHALARGRHDTRRLRACSRSTGGSATPAQASAARPAPARVPQGLSCSTRV
jgi:hypothetical protein